MYVLPELPSTWKGEDRWSQAWKGGRETAIPLECTCVKVRGCSPRACLPKDPPAASVPCPDTSTRKTEASQVG